MKKYMICLFLFAAVSAFCLGVGIGTRQSCKKNLLQETSQSESSSFQETEMADYEAANGQQVEPVVIREEYYLVAEDGFLLVFLKDQKTICLYTHVPLMDFPQEEQERLREGISVFFYDGCVPLSGVLYQLGKNILEKGRQTGYNRKEQKSWVRRIL